MIGLSDDLTGKGVPIHALGKALVSEKGEASGVALARMFIDRYRELEADDKASFFAILKDEFGPDSDEIQQAVDDFLASGGSPSDLSALHYATEPRRQELLRRINLAPGGIAALVDMRADLLDAMKENQSLCVVDADFEHLFRSWFNRGFLVLERIDWQTPAAILEKIIEYEAVHAIDGWDDLRRRVDAPDRRLYAFFHPALADGPLIFVEVALTNDVPTSIQMILAEDREPAAIDDVSTAVFYSISNCQRGLRGVTFGSFLIKQVVDDLRRELTQLRNFVTLSPIPGFRRWLTDEMGIDGSLMTDQDRHALSTVAAADPDTDQNAISAADPESRKVMISLAAHYLIREKGPDGRPADPVARFHLGNGARLDRIHWAADLSANGLGNSYGIMVNYRYVTDDIETNHEAYAKRGTVVTSSSVRRLLRSSRSADRPHPRLVNTEARQP